jgi:DNA-directed RNA polymerase I subunit RPA2
MDQQSFKLSVAAAHHIQSFNYITDAGLNRLLARFIPMELNLSDIHADHPNNKSVTLPFRSIKITYSQLKIGQPYRFNDPTALHQ